MKYRMQDGTIVDTERATASWDGASDWDGSNHISRATGSQWEHQTLFRSRKGRYYVEHTSLWQGTRPHVAWVSDGEAARWLAYNDHGLPVDLADMADDVSE